MPDPAHDDDQELLARLRANEEGAYAELVREQGGRMLAVARRLLRNDEDARDAVQDAFASAFKGLGSFAGGSRLSTWLHRITVNSALMKLRTRRRRPEVSLEDLLPSWRPDGHAAEPPEAWRAAEDSPAERAELRKTVREAIERLPETSRNVLVLRDIDGVDTADVAELLGVTPNAVKIRLHRARQALRQLLDHGLREGTR